MLVVFAGVLTSQSGTTPANAGASVEFDVVWGDHDCNGMVEVSDVISLLAVYANVPPPNNICPNGLEIGSNIVTSASATAVAYAGKWGDIDCDHILSPTDGLNTLKFLTTISYTKIRACAEPDTSSHIIDIGPVIPPPPAISSLQVDAMTAGNSANVVGVVDACRAVSVNDTFDVDVIVKGVPHFNGTSSGTGGLSGFDLALAYNPGVLQVTAVNAVMMLGIGSQSIFSIVDPLPDSDGVLHVSALDYGGGVEEGDGVLARLTVKALATGSSDLQLLTPASYDAPHVFDHLSYIYAIDSVTAATVGVGIADYCGPSTPTASPGPSPTPSPTPFPGTNECTNLQTPIAIPDEDPNGITDVKHFDDQTAITSVSLCLNVAHTWVGDLHAELRHAGDAMVLVNMLGSSQGFCDGNGNGLHVFLTDQAAASMEDACGSNSDVDGTYFANQYFTNPDFNGAFQGHTMDGDWTLFISDNENFNTIGTNTGELLGWEIFFNQ